MTSWCADLYTTQECICVDIGSGACPYKDVWWQKGLPGFNVWMEDWFTGECSLGTTAAHLPHVLYDTDVEEAVRRYAGQDPRRQRDPPSHTILDTNAKFRRLFYAINDYRKHQNQPAPSSPCSSFFERANFRLTVIQEPFREPSSILLLGLGSCRNVISKRAEASPWDQERSILLD